MGTLESEFLRPQEFNPLVWYRYIDGIFFIWTHGEEKNESFLDELNKYHINIKFTLEFKKESIPFVDLVVKLSNYKLTHH